MSNQILGLHHITAIATNAQENYDFYTKILGQRLVKRTVNFDDPKTYHFYFGDEIGTPGTILTFFPWEGMSSGKIGNGMAVEIGYSVSIASLDFWLERFKRLKVTHSPVETSFGQKIIRFNDNDGLQLCLVFTEDHIANQPWKAAGLDESFTTSGFNNVLLSLKNIDGTAVVLTELLGYEKVETENNITRFNNPNAPSSFIDLAANISGQYGKVAGGNIHHIAFQVENESILMKYRKKIADAGLNITDKIDRDYFYSIYFREPGGVLFEIATQNPGFIHDEPVEQLGINLKLPAQYESMRDKITAQLPLLNL